MARPIKEGLDYFPLNVDLADDDDCVELLEAEHGLIGYAILIKLWQKIYKNSYFINWNNDSVMLFAKKLNIEITIVNSVINTCLERNIFDNNIYEKYSILTSHGIQKRYINACHAAKRKQIFIQKEYLLIKEQDLLKLITVETPLTPEESTQKEGKEVKEEKEREGNAREDAQPTQNLFNAEFSKISNAWSEYGHGLLNTSNINTLREFYDKGLSSDVIIYALKEGQGKQRGKMRYIEAILTDKLQRGILTKDQLDNDTVVQPKKAMAAVKNAQALKEFMRL